LKKATTIRPVKTIALPIKAVASKNPLAKHFPVVGFGASAGGLEAFTEVLKNLDPSLGMAYVLIMHLSPTHKSSLAEILQTKTKMKVVTVKDGMKVKPNIVHVIPPNALLSLTDGHLKLVPRTATTIGNFAVDYFFTSLASTYKNNSIGVILSGNATDGTLGLKAIKAEGGITFAQDDTAKFPGMPKNAYDSGYADFMLSPKNIANELSQLVKIPYTVLPIDKVEAKHQEDLNSDTEVLKKILLIVKAKTGIDFFLHYKHAMIYRRVIRRVVLNKCLTIHDYCSLLERNEKEVLDLYSDFLINVTTFFRDKDFYETLDRDVFPSIAKRGKLTDPVRIWVAGCSTGEEAYSIAIRLREFLENKHLEISFQIFASDLDSNAIEKARLGLYPASALQNIPQNQLKRYFKKIDGHYQVEKNVREVCIFSQHNLLKDPPFSRIDLISCQNVLIYLETSPQQKILQTFHYALKPSGFLYLGKSETIGSASELFDPLDKKIRIYARKTIISPPLEVSFIKSGAVPAKVSPSVQTRSSSDIEKDISKILLTRFISPSVVLNQNLNIIQFFGITAPYLGPVVGKASLNVLKMIREDLLVALRALLVEARKTEKNVRKEGIKIYNKKKQQTITIEVVPKKTENEIFFLVVFKEEQIVQPQQNASGKKPRKTTDQKEQIIASLEEELTQSREVIRTTNEEYETTYEELQSHNEEILSSNEELQSVNEELETSKEELQSANEELTTINEELHRRNIELKESQNYAKAIVDTVNSPFLVLTSNLQVKNANKSFYNTFRLSPERTEGSFIYELGDHAWDIPVFRKSLNELFEKKNNYLEFELSHFFPGVGELSFVVNTYRFLNEDITKEFLILLAFVNISEAVKANKELKQLNEHLAEFTFAVSHDLQEPLRKIALFTNLLSNYENRDGYVKKHVDKINVNAERMLTLINGLLDYSTLLIGRQPVFQPVDLNATVKHICKDLELLIEEKHAQLNIAQLPTVDAVPILMYQLFFNIVKNALKFNNGKPIITITTEKISPEDYVEHNLKKDRRYTSISIKDNGIGFDQQYADRIFLLHQRLHDKQNVTGTGMGLAVSKKIVEGHSGAISALGKKTEGATFRIFLPIS
jgi:two-component system CheB/CheR fusion protein